MQAERAAEQAEDLLRPFGTDDPAALSGLAARQGEARTQWQQARQAAERQQRLLEAAVAARQAELARQAMRPDSLGAEQAGFVSVEERRLRMAGGEFCVNATRAFGALLAFRESASPEATLQGIARQKQTNENSYEEQETG